jgi:two-component system, OmpR family, sensor histidine kinase CpxA
MTTTTFLNVTHDPLTFWVGVRIPTTSPDGHAGYPAVLLLRTHSIFNNRLFFDWRALLVLAAVLAAIALACWWPFVHSVTASIRGMQRATAEIAQGRFHRHVNVKRSDELGRLGHQIDSMAERLEALVKYQKRFLGDIAHELCAPIARIQFALGILEQHIDSSPPVRAGSDSSPPVRAGWDSAQQTHVSVLREEIQQMSDLINELLMFSKAGLQPAEAPLTWVELRPAVERAVAHQLPGLGTIEVAVDAGFAVLAHEPFLVRAVSNLLRNALRYAGNDGPILVTSRPEGAKVVLSVCDCGPGLPEESLEEVFAPFYRPEAARSRDTGGAGLGLAIVKSCVEACHGTVTCRNREPSGLEVSIHLQGKTA